MDGEYHVICFYFVFGQHQEMLQALRDKIRQQLPSLVNTALDWRRLENVAKRVDPATLQAGVSWNQCEKMCKLIKIL